MFRRTWLLNVLMALCAGPLACNVFDVAIEFGPPKLCGPRRDAPKDEPPRNELAARADADNTAAKQPIVQTSTQVSHSAQPQPDPEEIIIPPPSREQLEKERQAAARRPVATAEPKPPEQSRQEPARVPPLVLAMQCFLDRRPVEAVEALKAYDKSSQDFFLSWLPFAARLIEGGLNRLDPQEATMLVAQLRRLLETLEPRANLVITKMCFCRRIEKFGVYQGLDESPKLRPKDWIVVYAELQNFTNERVAEGHAVRLSSRVEIRDYRGALVYEYGFPEKPDVAQSPRRDCFNGCAFYLDESIPPGLYTLRLRVKDAPTGRTATRTLDFQVAPYRDHGEY